MTNKDRDEIGQRNTDCTKTEPWGIRARSLGLHILSHAVPEFFWRRYSRLSRRSGLSGLKFVLSFDCDTKKDAAVVLDLDSELREIGAEPVYAVPGALLKQARDVYQQLHERGAEFLNHGDAEHTVYIHEKGRYESCFFYDRIGRKRVLADIEAGHLTLTEMFGQAPGGFRAPHFGVFRSIDQLSFVHRKLKQLGYFFSSSTPPLCSFSRGPFFDLDGILEFPVTGMFSRPLVIQDSWGFFEAPNRSFSPGEYVHEAARMAGFAKKIPIAGILNFYADPSHVAGKSEFIEAVRIWLSIAKPATFGELCRKHDVSRHGVHHEQTSDR